jgi:hypothetical protein
MLQVRKFLLYVKTKIGIFVLVCQIQFLENILHSYYPSHVYPRTSLMLPLNTLKNKPSQIV